MPSSLGVQHVDVDAGSHNIHSPCVRRYVGWDVDGLVECVDGREGCADEHEECVDARGRCEECRVHLYDRCDVSSSSEVAFAASLREQPEHTREV